MAPLEALKGNGNPCVCVCTYGNRAFDFELLQMYDILSERGFNVIAAGAFIAEHSLFVDDIVIQKGRPNEADLKAATQFGEKIKEKLGNPVKLDRENIPGNRNYKQIQKERAEAAKANPGPANPGPATNEDCIKCMLCANTCPGGAIDDEDPFLVDGSKCIKCLKCVRVCPKKAKAFNTEAFRKQVQGCYERFGTIDSQIVVVV